MGMFDFMMDEGTYDLRKIDRFEEGQLIVDTCKVSDGMKPFETAVTHPKYNDGKWIVVQAYTTKEEAQCGHDYWVRTMTNKTLPKSLKDCCNAGISALLEAVGGQMDFDRERAKRQFNFEEGE